MARWDSGDRSRRPRRSETSRIRPTVGAGVAVGLSGAAKFEVRFVETAQQGGVTHLVQQYVRQNRFGDPRGGLPPAWGQSWVKVSEFWPKTGFAHGLNLAMLSGGCGGWRNQIRRPGIQAQAVPQYPQYRLPGSRPRSTAPGATLSSPSRVHAVTPIRPVPRPE